jgi:hypothetical protein
MMGDGLAVVNLRQKLSPIPYSMLCASMHDTLIMKWSGTSQLLSNVESVSILAISLLYLDAFDIRSWGKLSFVL